MVVTWKTGYGSGKVQAGVVAAHLQMNPVLTFHAPFQLAKRRADGRKSQRRVNDKRMPLGQRIDEVAVVGNAVQRCAHVPAGASSNAPRPDCRRNSRKCSYTSRRY